MTPVKDIRKTVTDSTPVYAAVGATDLAVEKVRDARARMISARADLDVTSPAGQGRQACRQTCREGPRARPSRCLHWL